TANETSPAADQVTGSGPDGPFRGPRPGLEHVNTNSGSLEPLARDRNTFGSNDERESYPHVEGAIHLLLGDTSDPLQEAEHRWWLRPVFDVEPDGADRANEIEESVARHVRESADGNSGVEHVEDRLDVYPRRSKALLDQLAA